MDSDSIATIITLVLLVLTSSFFSATETAFSSLNRIRIKSMADNNNKRAALVYKLVKNYDTLLSTILVGNNIVNITSASIATVLCVNYFGTAGVTISTVVITVVILVFGEVTPKSAAKEFPEAFALFSAPCVQVLIIIFTPVNKLFSLWKKLISRFLKISDSRGITEDELLTILEEAEHDGAINEDDSNLIHNVIEFNDKVVNSILTPRVNIIGVHKDSSKQEITSVFAKSGHSRIPVFESSVDNIVGIIHIKDYLDYISLGEGSMEDMVKPVIFIASSMKISELFKKFQKEKSHFAIVTDEYGGTLGIVTMEDILEELMGEIWDEHDEVIEDFVKLEDGSYKIACSTEIDKMFEFFELTGEAKSTTVSGWIMERLGKIPDDGDEFEYENLVVTVKKTEQRRVIESIVKIKPVNPVADTVSV